MRKWVAAVALALAVVLFATAAWHRFEYRYCNAQRLELELASAGNPSQLAEYLTQDRARDALEFRQMMLGALLFLAGLALWTGRLYPEKLGVRVHDYWVAHRPHLLPHR